MDLISRLPTCLSGCLLSKWVTLRDIAKLDSSFCRTSTRTFFLTLIQSDECVSNDATYYDYSHYRMLSWVILRDVKLSSVCCASDYHRRLLNQHGNLNDNARHVQCLELRYSPQEMPSYRNLVRLTCKSLSQVECDLIGQNLHLQYLTVTDYDDTIEYEVAGSHQLRELVINVETSSIFAWLGHTHHHLSLLPAAFASSSLLKLVLGCEQIILDECVLADFAERCVQLEVLETDNMSITEAQLIVICRKCPRIHRLVLQRNNSITNEGIIEIVKHLQLRSLCLMHCFNLTSEIVQHIGQHCADTLTELHLDGWLRNNEVDNWLRSYLPKINVTWVTQEVNDESDNSDYNDNVDHRFDYGRDYYDYFDNTEVCFGSY